MELYAITQYMNQHYGLDSMDYGELAKNMKLIAIDEMRHAEQFRRTHQGTWRRTATEFTDKVVKAQDVRAIFPFDSKLEDDTIDAYNQFSADLSGHGRQHLGQALRGHQSTRNRPTSHHFDNVGQTTSPTWATSTSPKSPAPRGSTGGASKGFVLAAGEGA